MRNWPTYAAYTVLACAILTGSMSRTFAGLRLHEILLLVLAALLLVRRIVRRDGWLSVTLLDGAFALLILCGTLLPLVTLALRGTPVTPVAVTSVLGPPEWYLWYRVFIEALPMPRELPRLLLVLMVLVTINSVVGDLQAFHVPGVALLVSALSTTHEAAISSSVNRPTGLVGEWGLLASLAGCILFLGNQLFTDHTGRMVFGTPWWARILAGLLVLHLLALVAALAFEALIALACGLILAYHVNGRRVAREVLLLLGGGALFFPVVIAPLLITRLTLQFGASASLVPMTWQVRFLHWQIVFASIFGGGPATVLLGVSPNLVYPVAQFGGTESLYWLCWYRGGLVYLLAFSAFLATAIWLTWRLRRVTDSPLERSFLTWVWICLIVLSSIGVIDALFVDAGEVQVLMTLLAAMGGLLHCRGKTAQERERGKKHNAVTRFVKIRSR